MSMVTCYSGRCSSCSGRPLQHTTLLAAARRGKPSPLCVNLGGTPREDRKRILQTQPKGEFVGRWQTRVQEHEG